VGRSFCPASGSGAADGSERWVPQKPHNCRFSEVKLSASELIGTAGHLQNTAGSLTERREEIKAWALMESWKKDGEKDGLG